MSTDTISVEVVHHSLRQNLPFFAIASVVLVAGIASLLLAWLRSRERLLLWVGIFSVLYGSRLFIQNDLVHAAISVGDRAFIIAALCITYVIAIPYTLFARELLGQGWKKSITAWFWIEVAFALIAIPVALLTGQSHWTDFVNGIAVIGGTLLILLHVVFQKEQAGSFAKSLTWPLIIFGIAVVLTNRGFRVARMDVEPVGFLILLAGMGFTAARQAITRDRKLVEVEQELATARRIQSSIIPNSPPQVAGLRIAARYQPMTAVAGDFFDFIKTGEHSVTILVADVSGHGVPAALVASMLKVSFAAQREHAGDPAAVLTALNTMLCGGLGGQYVTAACAAIDLAANTVTYSGAGHPPGLLLRTASGEVLQLAENGLFIGPFAHASYSNVSASFQAGDKLLLYTDGITEATGADGQEFGRENLEKVLLNGRNSAPAALIEALFEKIATPAQQDDLTVVVAQFDLAGAPD